MSVINAESTEPIKKIFLALLLIVFSCIASLCLSASEELRAKAANPTVSPESLQTYVVPMTADELSELANVWQGHLSGALEEFIALNARLEGLPEASAQQVRAQIADLSSLQSVYGQNYLVVINGWAAKGASPEELAPHRSYAEAVRTALLRATDARTFFSLAWNWLGSRDGGLGIIIQLAVFLIAFLALLYIARIVRRFAERGLNRLPTISKLLRNFILTVVYWVTIVLGLMIALGVAGVNVTPMFAVFGGLSFILGFALQDTLGNLASGLMIMVLKPFDTGDYIEIAGASGTVDSMSVVSTQIRTFDNQIIVVPNSKIWGDVITNVSAAQTRRVDLVFGIAYSDSAPQAVEVLKALVAKDSRCLTDPAPEIFVGELGDSSVNLFCRPWVATNDYWDVYWGLTGAAKEAFDKEGISIPFPQRDVHLIPAET